MRNQLVSATRSLFVNFFVTLIIGLTLMINIFPKAAAKV